MEYRKLGKSDLNVSVLSLGGNVFGHFCDKDETKRIIDKALELGINMIDTADVYSNGVSEEYVGNAIRNDRQKWIIATKVGVHSPVLSKHTGKFEYILKSVEQSLKRLNIDCIDLYQMHHYDPSTLPEETLDAMNRLVEQGKIRYFGVSNYSSNQLSKMADIANRKYRKSVSSIQVPYNILKREIENEIIDICHDKEIGIIIYGALARGVLGGKYRIGADIPEQSRAFKSDNVKQDLTNEVLTVVESLINFSELRSRKINELAIAWALGNKDVSTLVLGTRNIEQIEENAKALSWKLSADEEIELDKLIGVRSKFNDVSLGYFDPQV